MRFIDTYRFSPVANGISLPWDDDPFHVSAESFHTDIYLEKVVDRQWWMQQDKYCREGFYLDDAIDKGGDALVDGVDVIWTGEDAYIKAYDWHIKNRRVWISGRHYFYLNFWKIFGLIENKGVKGLIYPKFLDMDYLFFLRTQRMIDYGKDSQDLKGRQLGFTEKGAGGVIGYNYTFWAQSLNLIIAGVEDDALKTMNDTRRGLDSLINTQFYKSRSKGGDNATHIKSKYTGSSIHCLTAKDNPQTASRFSPTWVWMDEIGKGKKGWSLDTAEYILPSIQAEGGKKTGYINYIGTVGEMTEGGYDLEQRHYNPSRYNILEFENTFDEVQTDNKVAHFTGKQWFYHIDGDGNSLIQKSKQAIIEKRQLLLKENNNILVKQLPLYANEVFQMAGGGFFHDGIIQILNERVSEIVSNKYLNIEKRGFLYWIDSTNKHAGVRFEPHANGDFYIYEHPLELNGKEGNDFSKRDYNIKGVPDNTYYAGTDSYDQDEANWTDSLGSCHIYKNFHVSDGFYKTWVARLVQRPTVDEGGADRFYENTLLLCVYYNARNLIEFSKWRIIDYYVKHGFSYLLKERPDIILSSFINKNKATNRYGIDASTKKDWLIVLRDKLTREFVSRMFDVEQMRKFIKFKYDPTQKRFNCDVTISSALSLIHYKDEEEYANIQDDDKDKKRFACFKQDSMGNIVTVFN